MGLQNTSSTHHIKFLTLATLMVCIWFISTIPSSSDLSYKLHIPGKSSKKPQSPLELLPLTEAKTYCEQRRWKPYPYRQGRRKIYDLIMINTELEWLETRMGQISPYVDYFVILESDKTFTDQEKSLHVRENMDRFKKYHSKMILHTLNLDELSKDRAWAREKFSRNAMFTQVLPSLTSAQEAFQGDVILVSDVDEIPRPDALKAFRNCDFPKRYCFPTVAELVTKIKNFSNTEMNQEQFTDRDKIVERVRNGRDMFGRDNEHYDQVEENMDVPHFLRRSGERYRYLLDPLDWNFEGYSVEEAEAYLANKDD
ncbi:hypothetical protein G7Y89_g8295 [Cudoniella acicularis]|uniref:Glycosyltransferase family 17 n=1 Tax=Cudoniella acicularis TaxID=354080 RepID=A0A8H4W175_9HELO|nr:hypothetical protein G7Y89_g8295 [Cudoniella acicularis]